MKDSLRRLGETQLVVKVDVRTAVILILASALTVYYARQFTVLALATYETVRNLQWNLVTAPFEAAVNMAHGAERQE